MDYVKEVKNMMAMIREPLDLERFLEVTEYLTSDKETIEQACEAFIVDHPFQCVECGIRGDAHLMYNIDTEPLCEECLDYRDRYEAIREGK